MADEAADTSVQMTVFVLKSILHVFGRIRNINEREESTIQASRKEYEAATFRARRSHRRKKAAAFWLCVQQQREKAIWKRERPSGEIFWADVLQNFDDVQWRRHFRMSRCTFEYVLRLVKPALTRKITRWRKPLEPRRRLAIVLWWYATPSEYRTISCLFGVGLSTVCGLVREVTSALKDNLLKRFICLPKGEQLQKTLDGFAERGYPMCAGAIDGSHISVIAPRDDPASYYNRKGWYSIVLQGVVDHNFCFTDIYVGCPGRTHDARVLRNSPIFKMAEEQNGYLFPCEKSMTVDGVEVPIHLVGDAAYPLKKWLMKGFTHHHLTPEQNTFNYHLSSARMVVENAFGRLKGRWRCLAKRNDVDISIMPDIVTACCILHNVCEINKETFLPEWDIDAATDLPQEPDTEVFHAPQTGSTEQIREAMMSIL
ncbi:protein ANTAGONIST OF LIKE HETEROCHROMATIN PROTEIN 1-like [Megalops cyprinoides]|uniref:protein ANTAGONIST OF LIKE HETEROCHROMATIN PROTEIN 1-like n=1 Tax=Megalops cyprinoides TaxID=118141 RepID=UPI001865288D|nr:protein ANTAGONIST OF LIKE HETEROCHROMATIN PROTEIN 1-like [Megalops cyprinoides]